MNGRFVPLEPPGNGLESVLVEGRRRRRRRAAGGSAAGATALAGVLALGVLSGPGGGTDSLQPPPAAPGVVVTPSPGGSPSPEPAPSPGAASPAASGAASAPAGPDGSPAAGEPVQSPRPAPQRPSPSEVAGGSYRTPDLLRSYAGPPASTTLCSPEYSNDPDRGRAAGWCVRASAERTTQGADLVVQVCRNGTASPSSLSFETDHEVDLAVLQDSRTLWQWSVGRSPRADEHDLATEAGACWSWRAPWTGVDQQGAELDSGGYVLRVRSQAWDLEGVEPTDTSFTL